MRCVACGQRIEALYGIGLCWPCYVTIELAEIAGTRPEEPGKVGDKQRPSISTGNAAKALVVGALALSSLGCALSGKIIWPWQSLPNEVPAIPAPVIIPPATPPPTTQTPSPVSTPTPSPGPVDQPLPVPTGPGAAVCPKDAPPLAELKIKVVQLSKRVGDATPRVNDGAWCAAQGRPEQDRCPFWKDDSDVRLACEAERALPLAWSLNGIGCTEIEAGCWPHPQPTKVFVAIAARGTLRACAPGGLICGEAEIE